MRTYKQNIWHANKLVMFIFTLCCLHACDKKLKPASVILVDPVRHYYPVIQGEMMDVSYEFENTSDNPLFIQEVQTTCGCLVPKSELPIVVLPHKVGSIKLTFNTIKNTGYVNHFIYCYGNKSKVHRHDYAIKSVSGRSSDFPYHQPDDIFFKCIFLLLTDISFRLISFNEVFIRVALVELN